MTNAPLSQNKPFLLTTVLAVLLVFGLVYAYVSLQKLTDERDALTSRLNETENTLRGSETKLAEYGTTLEEIRQAYAISEENGGELLEKLEDEKDRNEEFEDQIKDATKIVGKLDKLSKIDPEILMKYSKVYFLNEHYEPEGVKEIPEAFRFNKAEPEYIDAKVWPYFENLLKDAKEDGIELLVVSGYRSYYEQKGLKGAYTVQYGTGANAFSADQGYSEHQLGTTIDFTTTAVGGSMSGFQNTEAYAWLLKYGYKYGFVLSYPEGNAYYIFEPWHWRFVGEDLADELHDSERSFYDVDQREIDAFLISVFD